MADRSIKLKELKAILARYNVGWTKGRGKGSHVLFHKQFPEGIFTYPVPTHNTDINVCYIQACRKKFRLRVTDGTTDQDFYGR